MARPEHAKNFRGKAKNIPEQDLFMLPYQSRWINDQSILKIMEKSRRIGISYSTAYRVVRKHSLKDQRNDTWVSSRDEPTARLFIKDCKGFSNVLKVACEDQGMKLIEKESVYSLLFANLTELNSLASNPDVFAGKGGDVILDELALRKDPRGVYAIASPTIDWGGTLEMISTHRGTANYFNELCVEIVQKGNPKGISHHKVTLQDALDQGFLWKLQTKLRDGDPRLDMTEADYFDYQKKRAPDEETFNQEYCCIASDDTITLLSYDLIDSCKLRGPDDLQEKSEETRDFVGRKGKIRTLYSYSDATIAELKAPMFVGVDIGRNHDLTVIWLAARLMGILMPLKIIELYKVEFSRQEKELYSVLDTRGVYRCCIDATGIGMQLAERAQQKYGAGKVEAVTFSQNVKAQLASPIRPAFEDRSIRVPDDALIISDLRSITKETSGDIVRYGSDRGKNGHADRFWAMALMHQAAVSQDCGPVWVESTGGGRIVGNYDRFAEKLDLTQY